jgi:hypothetical protein
MLTTNIFVNSMISTKGAQFVTINIKDFMTWPEFMQLKIVDIT